MPLFVLRCQLPIPQADLLPPDLAWQPLTEVVIATAPLHRLGTVALRACTLWAAVESHEPSSGSSLDNPLPLQPLAA
jgi:hypothetical protein